MDEVTPIYEVLLPSGDVVEVKREIYDRQPDAVRRVRVDTARRKPCNGT